MKRSKGFTLVELLIVIVVIGILAAMMMLSSSEARSSAQAAVIISNLRNLKTAALAWQADNMDYVQSNGDIKMPTMDKAGNIGTLIGTNANEVNIAKYFNNDGSIEILTNSKLNDGTKAGKVYSFRGDKINDKNGWYVGHRLPDNTTALREKLKARASSLGLIFNSKTTVDASTTATNTNDNVVWMLVCQF